jgi:hypothetical protein
MDSEEVLEESVIYLPLETDPESEIIMITASAEPQSRFLNSDDLVYKRTLD